VPNAALTILSGGGHLAGYVDAGRVFDTMLPFIERGSSSGLRAATDDQ
jgi:hypothetical protein